MTMRIVALLVLFVSLTGTFQVVASAEEMPVWLRETFAGLTPEVRSAYAEEEWSTVLRQVRPLAEKANPTLKPSWGCSATLAMA